MLQFSACHGSLWLLTRHRRQHTRYALSMGHMPHRRGTAAYPGRQWGWLQYCSVGGHLNRNGAVP